MDSVGHVECQDNFPDSITRTFPTGDDNTRVALENTLWWWRQLTKASYHLVFRYPEFDPQWSLILWSVYRDYFETSAFMYEFRARQRELFAWDFGYPWPYCTRRQRRFLACLWPSNKQPLNPPPTSEGNRHFINTAPIGVNLNLHDSVAITELKSQLKRMREQRGLMLPKRGGAIKSTSWKPVEFLDRRHLSGEVLNDSETSQLSKAVKKYEGSCKSLGMTLL